MTAAGGICSNCPAPITYQSKSGLCRPCALTRLRADPEWQRRRVAGLRARGSDPAYRRRLAGALIRWHAANASDPAYQARQRENGRRLKATGLGNAVQTKGSAGRVRVGQILSDQRLAWCPREYRALYQEHRRKRGWGAERARQFVEEQIAKDVAAMTPFERAMAKVRAGAGIVEIRPMPRGEHSHSLTGCSMAMVAYG